MKMKKITIVAIALMSVCFVYSKTPAGSTYKIVNKISLEGNDKWDYLFSDDRANRLYVSHGKQVQVIDEVEGKVIGKVADLQGVHGIAIASDLKKGFISTKTDNAVTIFNTETFEVIKKVTMTGTSPDAILFDPFSKKVFVFNGHSNNATVLDAETNEIVATIKLTGNPEFAQTNRKGLIYVNLESASSIAVINATTYKVENVWSIAPGTEPTGLALDNEAHRLFSVCANKLMVVVNAETGKVITSLPIGDKVDGAACDAKLKCVYSSNGNATMTVVKEGENDTYSVLENVPTQQGARTIAINRNTHHIYLPAANYEAPAAGQKTGSIIPGSVVILDIMPQQ